MGYTTCPEIAPPIARQVDRDSGTFGVQSFDYGPVEIASEVGWNDYNAVVMASYLCLIRLGFFTGIRTIVGPMWSPMTKTSLRSGWIAPKLLFTTHFR
jgi:hypothetical protein